MVERRIHVLNAGGRKDYRGRYEPNIMIWVGTQSYCAPHYFLYFDDCHGGRRSEASIEAAIEEAAAWCADNAPGLLTSDKELYENCDGDCNHDNGKCSAEMDMMYTESGWIPSECIGVEGENWTPKQISDFAHNRE